MRANEEKNEVSMQAGEAEARFVDSVAGKRQAEDALRKSDARYQRLVELAPAAIAVHSEGKFVYANAAGARLLGAAKVEELICRPVLDFVHPDHVEFAKRRIRQNQEEGEPTELAEIKMVRLDGEVIDVETRGIPVTYEGRPATQVFILDITQRRRAEKEKAKVVEEYEAIIRVLPHVVFRWRKDTDGEMRPVYIEGALAEQFGVTTQRAAGKTIEMLFPPEFQETVVSAFKRAFAGETVEFPSRIGDRVFANVAMPFYSGGRRNPDQGVPAQEIVGFVSDVTERSRAEAEIRRLNGVLESRVAERTAQLEATVSKLEANERMLRESRAALQRSREQLVNSREEERRRLRRDLHDGLGPQLACLTMMSEAARDLVPNDPARAQEMMEGLAEQAQAAVADVRRLVYALRPPALDALGLMGALRSEIMVHQDHNGLLITIHGPEELPPLPAAVEVAAYRIALEALTNVVRHAEARKCMVRLGMNEKLSALRLEVEDDGRGIEENRRAGVGLTSMRERAEELGGSCTVEAVPSGGTRIRAFLPYARDEVIKGEAGEPNRKET